MINLMIKYRNNILDIYFNLKGPLSSPYLTWICWLCSEKTQAWFSWHTKYNMKVSDPSG